MTLLLDKMKAVQYEAFRAMQVLVKESSNYPLVAQILKKNQEHLIEFFMEFQNERGKFGYISFRRNGVSKRQEDIGCTVKSLNLISQ